MGLFSKKKDDSSSSGATIAPPTGGISIEAKARFTAIKGKAGFAAGMKGLSGQKARVAAVLDISGSMQSLYQSGIVQKIVERMLALGVTFDDNGAVDMFLFSNGSKRRYIGELTEANFEGAVDRIIKAHDDLWGATDYAPVMEMVVKKYTSEPGDPGYVAFFTDGDNYDKPKTKQVIIDAAKHPIFWQFVGIGSARKNFLEMLDTMEGRVIDNANFFDAGMGIEGMDDGELFDKMLVEFPDWLSKAKTQGIIA